MNQIDSKLDSDQIFRIIVGSMRFTINRWCLSGFEFNLVEQGHQLWKTLKILFNVKK